MYQLIENVTFIKLLFQKELLNDTFEFIKASYNEIYNIIKM